MKVVVLAGGYGGAKLSHGLALAASKSWDTFKEFLYHDYDGTVYGINVNRLTKNTHRDPIGTPLHRYVPCRVEKI